MHRPFFTRPACLSPRGITLLEVMVSIFVMTLGVLSVAAGILTGAAQAVRGNIADRSAACGRAALNEFRIRGFNRPDLWQNASGAPVVQLTSPQQPPTLPAVLDPWMLARLPSGGARAYFGNPILPRYQLSPTVFTKFQHDLAFTSLDDLSFYAPDDGDSRPSQLVANGARTVQGDFTWMALIAPADGDDGRLVIDANGKVLPKWVNVSIAVYFKRGLDPVLQTPLENSMPVTVAGGYGGVTASGMTALPPENRLTSGRWVLLIGQRPGATRVTCKWYRVTSVDNSRGDDAVTAAALSGPDWPGIANAVMIVPDGVVGVYEKTMLLEGSNMGMWSAN